MLLDVYFIIFLLVASATITYILVPRIIGVARYKRLMDKPNERSSHAMSIPNLGGIAFYVTLMMSFYFLDHVDRFNIIPSLLPGLTILFVMGLKDDLTVLTARTKLFSQIIACIFLLAHYKFEIYSLKGFLGITSINPYFAGALALFLMVAIINAFNLIDGIDGLASIIGLIIFLMFGTMFYFTKSNLLFGICIIMVGSLSAFLRYNFSHRHKIFMGDTGSMLVGFIVAGMAIRFLSMPSQGLNDLPFKLENVPFVMASILIIPLFDMTRVFIIRLLQGRGPFSPDRNHIHHLLIDKLNFSHAKASVSLGIFNILFLALFLYLSIHFSVYQITLFFILALISMTIFLHQLQRKHQRLAQSEATLD